MIDEPNWEKIDLQILQCNILGALIEIRAVFGGGINDAELIHIQRYRVLRETRPNEFKCSDEAYWQGVYG
jgi:hypothetical protein